MFYVQIKYNKSAFKVFEIEIMYMKICSAVVHCSLTMSDIAEVWSEANI